MGSVGQGDALMLIATITTIIILSLSGGAWWVDTMGDLASEVIEDGERLERADQASDAMRETLTRFEENVQSHRAELIALDADYFATAEDYHRVLSKLDQEWKTRNSEHIALRFEFRDQFTREEWEELVWKLDEKLKPE
jgi:hypothetical protein